MTNKRPEKIKKMFDELAPGYDFMNSMISFGVHKLIKKSGIKFLKLQKNAVAADLCCGTGDIAGLLAGELGANVAIAKRGGLLHDIGKALDFEMEGTHVSIGVEVAKKYKESPEVIHCIEAHHGGVEYKSIEAILVQVADAISSSRPGARRESLDAYVKRLEKLEQIANSFKGVESSFAIQAGREIRIAVKPEEVDDASMYVLANEIARKIESELEYPGQIKVNIIRETRASDIAS